MVKGISIALSSFSLILLSFQTAVAEELPYNEADSDILESSSDIYFDSFDESSSTLSTTGDADGCKASAKVFCTVYCQIQSDYSYSTCMNGALWYDGCVKKITKKCLRAKKKKSS